MDPLFKYGDAHRLESRRVPKFEAFDRDFDSRLRRLVE